MTDQVNQEEQSAAPQLSLQDIATTVQVIDICSRRGGFEGAELSAVGGLMMFAMFACSVGTLTILASSIEIFKHRIY